MAFEYCCFISYPHGQQDVLVPFVQDLVDGLKTEIHAQSRKKIWIDYDFLEGGDRLDATVGRDLCKSACMILIYTPLYFDREHTYCARELQGMQKLEERRLALLNDPGEGLIIPIVLRGEKRFPEALKKKRIFYRFTDIEFNNPEDIIRHKYSAQIKEIAEYIIDRCETLDEVADKLLSDCHGFNLPTEEDAKMFVETVLQRKIADVAVPFPVRT